MLRNALMLGLLVCLGGVQAGSAAAQDAPQIFICSLDGLCPEVAILEDPPATLGDGSPSPFRGYGDPSLEFDPDGQTLWLSYSWLELLTTGPDLDLGVSTHLARSDDFGQSFQFVNAVNDATREVHPDSGADGWRMHEVSTLVQEADGGWQLLVLDYFDNLGDGPRNRSDVHLVRSLAASPDGLIDASPEPWIGGPNVSTSFGVRHDLSEELSRELGDCAVFTEPALLSYRRTTYLAVNCLVVDETGRRADLERLVLLRQKGDGYQYLGILLDSADAAHLGAGFLEQADLSVSRDDDILLIVTPIVEGPRPNHRGCIVYTVDNIRKAEVRRDDSGHAVPRAFITTDDLGLDPDPCTYDKESETGVLMITKNFDFSVPPFDIEFSLRATGVHP